MSGLVITLSILTILVVSLFVVVLFRRRRLRQGAPSDEAPRELMNTAVVLAHGLAGFTSVGIGKIRHHYFHGIREGLEQAGIPTFVAKVPPLGTIPERASELVAFIQSLPHTDVMIVAHSMGGLDARYAITKLGLHQQVRVLITIGTPHRGSPVADGMVGRHTHMIRRFAERLGIRSSAIDWLTTGSMARFNEDVVDHPSVAYYSVVGRASPNHLWHNPLLLCAYLWVRKRGGENDGFVPVESQQWGEILEEIDADHFAQIGWSTYYRADALYLRILLCAQAKRAEEYLVGNRVQAG